MIAIVQTDEDFAADPQLVPGAVVRGADTARPDLAAEAPGRSPPRSAFPRMFAEDSSQLEAGVLLYDAFYRWCRDATAETHNWPVKRGA